MERYNFKTIEEKWQKFWQKNKSFKTELDKIGASYEFFQQNELENKEDSNKVKTAG